MYQKDIVTSMQGMSRSCKVDDNSARRPQFEGRSQMSQRRVEISDETGDVYLCGGDQPIGHVEDFLHERTALAKAVKARWKQYLLKLDQFAARRDSSISPSV